ncbi:MAG: TetR/AcrR family transcriptional regulator, partial [Flavobacteriaceae bacterium]|nr:TetR/AcrR family transcriptional regulator [Flavobacteriaceae bacterium]
IAIDILTRTTTLDSDFEHIDEVVLKRIIIHEYSKSYLTKQVDLDNDEGYFTIYKRIVLRLKKIIIEVDSDYNHPFCLANTVIEGALHQQYLKDHFKSISGLKPNEAPTSFYKDLVFNTLNITLNE